MLPHGIYPRIPPSEQPTKRLSCLAYNNKPLWATSGASFYCCALLWQIVASAQNPRAGHAFSLDTSRTISGTTPCNFFSHQNESKPLPALLGPCVACLAGAAWLALSRLPPPPSSMSEIFGFIGFFGFPAGFIGLLLVCYWFFSFDWFGAAGR